MKHRHSTDRRGLTLIEVLVTGTLFAVVLSMIAQALVVGSRTQSVLSHKIAVHRQASMALDAIVRDAEMARYVGNVIYVDGTLRKPVPNVPPPVDIRDFPDPPKELWFERMEGGATVYDPPTEIIVGYFHNTSDNTLRQMHYENDGITIWPGTPNDGKVLARDVRDFDAILDVSTGVPVLVVRIQVATINEHIVTQTTLE